MLTEPQWFWIVKYLHIVAGALALTCGTAAFLLRNKTEIHRWFGKFYFWSMAAIAVTSLAMGLYHQKWFLFMVAIFTFHSAFTAYRSLYLTNLHKDQKAQPWDWFIEALTAAGCLFLVGYALYAAAHEAVQLAIICLVFGGLGLRFVLNNVLRYLGRIKYKQYAMLQHVTGMLGSYAGAWTAFLVTNNHKWHMPDLVAFLLPTVIVTVLIVRERARYRKMGYIKSIGGKSG